MQLYNIYIILYIIIIHYYYSIHYYIIYILLSVNRSSIRLTNFSSNSEKKRNFFLNYFGSFDGTEMKEQTELQSWDHFFYAIQKRLWFLWRINEVNIRVYFSVYSKSGTGNDVISLWLWKKLKYKVQRKSVIQRLCEICTVVWVWNLACHKRNPT